MAITNTVSVNLEMDSPNNLVLIHAVQGEYYSRQVTANLYNNGSRYTIPNEAIALIRYRKPDASIGFYDFDAAGNRIVTIPSDGTYANKQVIFTIAPEMCDTPGRVFAHIDLYSKTSGNRLSAFYFELEVEKAATDSEIYKEANVGGVQDLIKEIIGSVYTPSDPLQPQEGAIIDNTLSIPGAVGDAKAMGDVVLVQDDEPDTEEQPTNKLWIDSDSLEEGIEVPDMADIVSDFDSTKTYSYGDYVNYEGHIYKYIDDTASSGSWDNSKWEQSVICDDISDNYRGIHLLFKDELIDYSAMETTHWSITAAGKWSESVRQLSVIFELQNIKSVHVTGVSQSTAVIAFLKTYNPVYNEHADFSENYPNRITLSNGDIYQCNIENDMNYMFVLLQNTSGVNVAPNIVETCINTDKTLNQPNIPADAFSTGYLLTAMQEDIVHNFDLDEQNGFVIVASDTWRNQNVQGGTASRSKIFKIQKNTTRLTVSSPQSNAGPTVCACLKHFDPVDYNSTVSDYSTGWIRTYIPQGESKTFDLSDDCNYFYATQLNTSGENILPEVVEHRVKNIFLENNYLTSIDSESQDETDMHDRTAEIELLLSRYGECKLSKGIFYVTGINMPENTRLIGSGNGTVIKLLDSIVSGSAIKINSKCSVSDLMVKGSYSSSLTPATQGDRYGIEWTGNTLLPSSIENVQILGFTGAGIYLHDTTQNTYRNLQVCNCFIHRNYIGIYIRKNSEFNNFVNCTIYANTIGYYNRGGNNKLSNCGIDANKTGILIDIIEGSNSGHGSIIGCTINHSDSNTGYGLIIDGSGRMLISGCNFYYSKIKLKDTNGNIISGCGFGNSANWEIINGECSLFSGCIVKDWDTNTIVSITNNNAIKIINCYDRQGNIYNPII